MEITTARQEDLAIVSIHGSIDALTAGQLSDTLHAQIDEGDSRIIADLAQVEFMSSAGLRAILGVLKQTRQNGGDLRLAAPQPGVEKVLKLSGFTSILKTYPSLEEALADFSQ
jgi:anti-sigma B factor antagonist